MLDNITISEYDRVHYINWFSMFGLFLHSICKDGYRYIGALILASILTFAVSWGLGLLLFIVAMFCCYFFRDPVRHIPVSPEDDIFVSPADGVVTDIEKDVALPEAQDATTSDKKAEKYHHVVIFLSVMNVHVNRFPTNGVLEKIEYYPGKCIIPTTGCNIFESQRQEFHIKTNEGKRMLVIQMAGMLARRLVSYVEAGHNFVIGEKLGIIKFSSRVDVYLPSSANVCVAKGQTVLGGETIIGCSGQIKHGYECKAI